MKRALIIVGITVLVLVALVVGVFASAFAGNAPIVDGAELAPGVHTIKDGIVSVFMVDTDPGHVALIDAGNSRDAGPILAALRRNGLDADAVRAIFLTHGHPDHTHGVLMFPHADVYAMAADVPLIEGRAGSHSPMSHLMGSPKPTGIHVTHSLTDGEAVQVGALKIRAFAVPGHTAGSASFLARGVLFMGDNASGGTNGLLRPAVWLFSDNAAQNVASLRLLATHVSAGSEPVQVIAFAHSGPLHGLAPLTNFSAAH